MTSRLTLEAAKGWSPSACQASAALATYAVELEQAQNIARAAAAASVELNAARAQLQNDMVRPGIPASMQDLFGPDPNSPHDQALVHRSQDIQSGVGHVTAMAGQAGALAAAAEAKAAAALSAAAGMTSAAREAAAAAAHPTTSRGKIIEDLVIGDPLHDPVDAIALIPFAKVLKLGKAWKAARALRDLERVTRAAKEAEEADALARAAKTAKAKPDWLKQMDDGNAFHRAEQERLGALGYAKELHVQQPGRTGYPYNRVDAYLEGREIVSIKHSQLSEIQPSTAKGYLNEFVHRYKPGTEIAGTPTTAERLQGKQLEGDMYLQVPVQNVPVPPDVLKHAEDLNIVIRDIEGKIYR